jgi:uncharacterized membrane protein YiaA
MPTIRDFLRRNAIIILGTFILVSIVGVFETHFGRSLLGPDGKFGWWDGNVWGSENSQRVADAYSFSHLIHGMLFYGLLWLVARRLPAKYRFLAAVVIECVWEVFENSSFVINRYRDATIAQGYVGDSVLNSVSDIGMMMIGFCIARYSKIWATIVLIIVFELGCLFWIRDNLTLNILMLTYPIESVKVWQSEGH